MGGALVIGGDSRALGIARSLGRRGIEVWVIDEGDYLVARRSRYVRRSLPWPGDVGEAEQARFLLALADEHRLHGWTLFATSDETAALVARHHAALAESFRLTTPAWEQTRLACDKLLTYELAAKVGVAAPWTHRPASRGELESLDLSFPCILKPAAKQGLNRFTHDKAWRVDDRDELLARYDEACSMVGAEHVMVQELIPGGGETQFSFGAACVDGRPVGSIVARRRRQYPVTFGHSSSFVETVDAPEVERDARRLLEAIGYSGLVEVELKRDPRSGEYKVLDVNPRLWTWFALGARAGVDFPYLGFQLARGELPEEARARPGVRWVRMATDVLAASTEIRRGSLSLGAYLRSIRPPVQFAVFAADDPRPLMAAVPSLFSRMARRAPTLLGRRGGRAASEGSGTAP
jgi:predicted ATP-grasp superfamily ATP-dependent carboligase